ncbi:MAG TPA: ABC transporter substrate-binding protein, partial [Synergistaceae bacterium]|nr:ABC transporter substrate-binding protein [Synergistaceae bacterium]
MKKDLLGWVLAGMLLAGSAGAEAPIAIGHSVSLTGGSSMWGLAEQNALDMLVEELNAAGGVLGRKLEIIHYDNRGDAVESVNVARRLVDDGVVAVIGPA